MTFSPEAFSRLQHRGAVLAARLNATVASLPETITGTDPTGSIHVGLDRNSLIRSISVVDDWKRSLRAEQLDAAILEASNDAYARYAETVAAARRDVDALSDDEVLATAGNADALDSESSLGFLSADRPFAGTPRPVIDIAEEFIAMPTPSTESAAVPPPTRSEPDVIQSRPNVALVFDYGRLIGSATNANWAFRQSGTQLNAALDDALELARTTELAPVEPQAPRESRRGEDIIAELLQSIKDLTPGMKETP